MAEFKNRHFGVANPTDHPIKIQIEVTLPKFLQDLGWRAIFPDLKSNKLTLKAKEQRDVKMMLKRGKDFEPISVEKDQEGARIRVITISDDIVTGGITYQLDAKLKKPAPKHLGKETPSGVALRSQSKKEHRKRPKT
jgi:hypothetical protein